MLSKYKFDLPKELISLTHEHQSRILCAQGQKILEITKPKLFDYFKSGDVLVINNSKTIPCRLKVFHKNKDIEILFLKQNNNFEWEVLFNSKKIKTGEKILLPENIYIELLAHGIPQKVRASQKIDIDYFKRHGLMPIPPYILKNREFRENEKDPIWYQNFFSQYYGSSATATSGLHFNSHDFEILRKKGVEILEITLHVGLGTFLPLNEENFISHTLHSEKYIIKNEVLKKINIVKKSKNSIWALGTTVTRALESYALNKYQEFDHYIEGDTDLFIEEGFNFKMVDNLLTNFHWPESSLLVLVCSFFGYEEVMNAYHYAIENKFKFFSYGDLSVWIKK